MEILRKEGKIHSWRNEVQKSHTNPYSYGRCKTILLKIGFQSILGQYHMLTSHIEFMYQKISLPTDYWEREDLLKFFDLQFLRVGRGLGGYSQNSVGNKVLENM